MYIYSHFNCFHLDIHTNLVKFEYVYISHQSVYILHQCKHLPPICLHFTPICLHLHFPGRIQRDKDSSGKRASTRLAQITRLLIYTSTSHTHKLLSFLFYPVESSRVYCCFSFIYFLLFKYLPKYQLFISRKLRHLFCTDLKV